MARKSVADTSEEIEQISKESPRPSFDTLGHLASMRPQRDLGNLNKTLKEIEKIGGKGAIFRLDDSSILNVPHISTGIPGIDDILGIGGFPYGRIIELYGMEGSFKTGLLLSTIGQINKLGGVVAFIDMEHALTPAYAKLVGVDFSKMYVAQPSCAEEAFQIAEQLIESNVFDMVVIDSVAALVTRAELEGDFGDSHMGITARLMGQALRKLLGLVEKKNVILAFTNQLRSTMNAYGAPQETTGGKALRFFASVRLEMKKKDQIKNGDQVMGLTIEAKVIKNKLAPPFRTVQFDFRFTEGIDTVSSLIGSAVEKGVIKKGGAGWFNLFDEKIQGYENLRNRIKDDAGLIDRIKEEIVKNPTGVPQDNQDKLSEGD